MLPSLNPVGPTPYLLYHRTRADGTQATQDH